MTKLIFFFFDNYNGGGGSFFLLRIFERGRNSLRSVFMGKDCAMRMLSIMENFILSEIPEHFARTVREGETVFIIQSGSNTHGYYLMISELLHGRRKGFLVIPEGRMGHGWRGFVWHLKKVLDQGIHASNRSPLFLPGSELRANTSYAAAVVHDHRSEPRNLRLAAEGSKGSGDQAILPFLNSCNHSSAKLVSQTQDSRKSCLGKEKNLIGLQLPLVASDGTDGELIVDLQFRLVRGPLGTWEVSWSKVSEVPSSSNQTVKPNPPLSPTNSFKPIQPSASQLYTAKPSSNSQPNSYQPKQKNSKPNPPLSPSNFFKPKQPSVSQLHTAKPCSNLQPNSYQPIQNITKPKPISNSKPKPTSFTKPKPSPNPKVFPGTRKTRFTYPPCSDPPKAKPSVANPKPNNNYKWKPKTLRSHILTLHPSPHPSPSLPSSSSSSVLGSENSDTVLSSTHMLPMCSEQVSSVPDNSEASVSESLASEASSDTSSEDSLCSDDDGDVQRNIQQIIHQHTDEVIKKWGNSEQWVLELRNGKRVAVPIQISLPSGEDIGGVKDFNPLAIVPGRATESKEFNDELDKGMDVFVEDWSSDFSPEKAS